MKEYYLVLGVILYLTLISESREIARRTLPKDEFSGNEEIPLLLNPLEKGKKLDPKPVILGPPAVYDDYYDNEVPVLDPVAFDENRRILKDRDGSEVEYTDSKEPEEGNVYKEHEPEGEEKAGEERKEAEEEEEEEENDDKENMPGEEGKLDGESKEEEEIEIDDKDHIPEEVENSDEGKKDAESDVPKDDDENAHVPEEEPVDEDKKVEMPSEMDEETAKHGDDEKDEENIPQDGEEGSLNGGSIFDTPFFNLEQVKKYFGQLERALGHVFRQTMDEAVMLNGTYANTTEEEVDIDGKKYIVTKSLIKGGDNHSSIYVEALSAKPQMNSTEIST